MQFLFRIRYVSVLVSDKFANKEHSVRFPHFDKIKIFLLSHPSRSQPPVRPFLSLSIDTLSTQSLLSGHFSLRKIRATCPLLSMGEKSSTSSFSMLYRLSDQSVITRIRQSCPIPSSPPFFVVTVSLGCSCY